MKIWLTRHGQTKYNAQELMQGRTDEPLNDVGRKQALETKKKIGDVKFDAVFASPLDRAIETASIVSGWDRKDIQIDERIIEVDFGDYELRPYTKMGPRMTFYWALPEVIPNPKSVESVKSMVERSHAFLRELEQKDYENVLIVCHGGIIRALTGYLTDKKKGFVWRPKPKNCEVRVFECKDGKHKMVQDIL